MIGTWQMGSMCSHIRTDQSLKAQRGHQNPYNGKGTSGWRALKRSSETIWREHTHTRTHLLKGSMIAHSQASLTNTTSASGSAVVSHFNYAGCFTNSLRVDNVGCVS